MALRTLNSTNCSYYICVFFDPKLEVWDSFLATCSSTISYTFCQFWNFRLLSHHPIFSDTFHYNVSYARLNAIPPPIKKIHNWILIIQIFYWQLIFILLRKSSHFVTYYTLRSSLTFRSLSKTHLTY